MKTLEQFQNHVVDVPMQISWLIGDLMEFKGKQELFTRQIPQKLQLLREHALIESAVSSNRIEGVEVDQKRIKTLVFGQPALHDRDEEEVAGYRSALTLIHSQGAAFPVSAENILRIHKMIRGDIWDAGRYKDKPVDIVEILPNGERTIRFKSVSPEETPAMLDGAVDLLDSLIKDSRIHPFILLGAFNLDFLCVHPFRDGNGRVSRLLLLLMCYHFGLEAGRYISLERIIEQNKERYYETLKISSQRWHEGRHDPWPYIGYLLFILKRAYQEFEERVGQTDSPRGDKTQLIENAIKTFAAGFSVSDLQHACPGVSMDLIRRTLKVMQELNAVKCVRKGRNAKWMRIN